MLLQKIRLAAIPAIAYIAGIILAVGLGVFFVWGQYEANVTIRRCFDAGARRAYVANQWGQTYRVVCETFFIIFL